MRHLANVFGIVALLAWMLADVPAAGAQRRGHGGNRGSATMQQGAGTQGQIGQQSQARGREYQRFQVDLPAQQRDRYQSCTVASDRARKQAHALSRLGGGSHAGFSVDEARQQRDQLREHANTMFREHERFMENCGDNLRNQLRDRSHKLDQARERIHTRLQAMDRELGRDAPDRERFRTQARELEKATKTWRKQVRRLGGDLGVRAS